MKPPIHEAKPPFFWWPRNRIIRRIWFSIGRLYDRVYFLLTTKYACNKRYVLWRSVGIWWDREEAEFLPEGVEPSGSPQSLRGE